VSSIAFFVDGAFELQSFFCSTSATSHTAMANPMRPISEPDAPPMVAHE